MKNFTFTSLIAAFCVVFLITITACSSRKNETDVETVDNIGTSSTMKVTPATSISALDFNLYPLSVLTSTFVTSYSSASATAGNTKLKLLLQFIITNDGSSNYLSLNGWYPMKQKNAAKDTAEVFDTTSPNIQLTKITAPISTTDNVPISSGTYFGNLFINRNTLNHLYKKAMPPNPSNKYMIFFPTIVNNHIQYAIGFAPTNNSPAIQIYRDHATDGIANPTPPRQYDTN